ncbi:protein root initiation defective 3 [Citrus sinensis]|uniref:Uncharacterized protein n=1 Tax=Citrus sinensis TaxID=2711 RepID=A0A067GZN1_CITSI|nr:protein ROOT INITIATION DEFECTIVE 3 [Citrus sinensis]KAH9692440.1 protein root initiation defective 3 [Citrus sinensis]KDO84135.1 hypothetical protein CISIN_1g012996mg [Citrus sinensis]
MELLIASSSVADTGIGCWDLESGAEQLRYKSCASPPHGLACVGQRFLASSQLREQPSASSGSILYWSWSKPQVEVKSLPAEPIKPIAANSHGTYIAGGGQSGDIYMWEVASGRLLKKWHAHYRAVTCLVFSEDGSFLISGSEDGCVRIWSLLTVFEECESQRASHLYLHSFTGHTLRITDIVIGYGGVSATIVSASEDRTCKVWSLLKGRLLRNIVFPSVIDAIALDPAEHVFYAGSRDGSIYIAALNAESPSTSSYGMHIIGSLSDHSKAVTCLAYSTGDLLISGSEDGMVRVWDPITHNIVRMFRLAKGPVNNILVVRRPLYLNLGSFSNPHTSSRRHGSQLPPPLDKYVTSADEDVDKKGVIRLPSLYNAPRDASYISHRTIENHIKELQQQGSSAATEMEVERLKRECNRTLQMVQQWKKMYENLHEFCVNELLDGDQVDGSKRNVV